MYKFYLDEMELPVTPSSLTTTINNKNETIDLMNEQQINIIKKPDLTDFSFECILPLINPIADSRYPNGEMVSAKEYLDKFEELKQDKKEFQFIIIRDYANQRLWYNNTTVSLEDYEIVEDAENGDVIKVSINLKQWRKYETQKLDIKIKNYKPKIASKKKKNSRTSGNGKGAIGNKKNLKAGETVIVNGRLHVDSYGNGPGQWRRNWKGKISWFNWKGSHPVHITTMSGGWQGWVKANEVRKIGK